MGGCASGEYFRFVYLMCRLKLFELAMGIHNKMHKYLNPATAATLPTCRCESKCSMCARSYLFLLRQCANQAVQHSMHTYFTYKEASNEVTMKSRLMHFSEHHLHRCVKRNIHCPFKHFVDYALFFSAIFLGLAMVALFYYNCITTTAQKRNRKGAKQKGARTD